MQRLVAGRRFSGDLGCAAVKYLGRGGGDHFEAIRYGFNEVTGSFTAEEECWDLPDIPCASYEELKIIVKRWS